jgi:DNA-binding transcriptional LysR family regulator
MSLEVRQMRHVLALAEHGSFARAAMTVGLSQSALSRSIQSVEREAGSQLFVRTASGVEPTDSGRVFIARIRQIVQLTEDLDRDLVSDRGLQSGHLHVGAGPYPAQSMLTDALARFVADYPRVVVRVMMRDWDELLRRLRAREIEFFVGEFSTFGNETDIDVAPLDMHPTLTYVRHGHPLAARAPVSFADGFPYPNASLTRIPPRLLEPIRALQRRLPEGLAIQRVFPALEFNSLEAVKRIVLGSDALMVAPPRACWPSWRAGSSWRSVRSHFSPCATESSRSRPSRSRRPPLAFASTCWRQSAPSPSGKRNCSSAGGRDRGPPRTPVPRP